MNNFIFYGSDDFSIEVLKVLLENNFKPDFCITQPDRPKGRKLVMTPPPIKKFCEENDIKVLQPEILNKDTVPETSFAVVASYGKIISKEIVELPKLGTLNVHPSLLPKYRGASPIETTILNDDKKTGVTIMLMDEKMDHGPIISQKEVIFETWPDKQIIRDQLAKTGGEMVSDIIPQMIEDNLGLIEQEHDKATYTKMIKKADGEINLEDSAEKNYLKFIALNPWPGTFYFIYPERSRVVEKDSKQIRIKITEAVLENNEFIIKKVIPEGKSEMTFESFENGYLK
jgi:methionyl-tRNA formyltransferase